jgi:PAS domain S-box-containing protein
MAGGMTMARGRAAIPGGTGGRAQPAPPAVTDDDRLRVIYEQAPVGIGETDLDGIITAVNARICEITGYDADELVGRTIGSVTHPDDLAGDAELFAGLVAGAIPSYRRQKRYVRKDGAIRWIDLWVTLIRDAAGQPSSAVGIVQDITEHKRTEEALRENQSRLDFALHAVSAAFWEYEVGASGHVLGPSYYAMLGYSAADAPHDRAGWLALLHPDDRPIIDAQAREWKPGETGYRETEFRIRARDGSWRWLLTRYRPVTVDVAGRPARLVGIDTDITARKHAELALQRERDRAQQYLDIAGSMIVVLDVRERVVMVNRRACAVLGLSEAEAIGRNWYDSFVPTANREQERAEYRELLAGRRGTDNQIETLVRNRRGEVRIVAWHDTVLRGDDGVVTGTLSSGEDITDRRRAEEASVAARQQAEAANRAKSEFLARVSHELRTPLNAVLGFSEIMHSEAMGPIGNRRYKEFAEHIHASGTHLLSLIDDILDLSKIEAGRLELHEEEVAIGEVVDQVCDLMRQRADDAGLTLSVRIADALPPIRADKRALKQILLNLLSNAVKFTPRGGGVALGAGREPDGGIAIGVADTGIGIAAADIAKAMEPFGQVDSSLTRRYQGAGLGLPISRSLIELHGGRLDLDSKPGAGTTATIRLPPERAVGPERGRGS